MGLSNSKAEPEVVEEFTPRKASALGSVDAKGGTGGSKKRASSSSIAINAESLLLEASLMHGITPADMEDEHHSRGTVSTKGSPDLSLDGAERAPGNRKANATHHPLLGWLHRPAKSPADSSSKPPHHIHVIPSTTSATTRMAAPSATIRESSSANTTPTRSSKLPIPRSRNSIYNNSNRTSYDDDDIEHLKRLYQARTWEMYYRITEARKRSSLNDLNSATCVATGAFATSNQCHPSQLQQHTHPHAFFMAGAVAVSNNPSSYGFYNNAEQPAPTTFHHQGRDDNSEHELFLGDFDC